MEKKKIITVFFCSFISSGVLPRLSWWRLLCRQIKWSFTVWRKWSHRFKSIIKDKSYLFLISESVMKLMWGATEEEPLRFLSRDERVDVQRVAERLLQLSGDASDWNTRRHRSGVTNRVTGRHADQTVSVNIKEQNHTNRSSFELELNICRIITSSP